MENKLNSLLDKIKKTGFLHIFGSGLINKVIQFLSSYILILVLSKYDYGVYSYAQNIINFFMIASGFGIVSGLLQFSSENMDKPDLVDAYMRKCSLFGIIVNVLLALSIFLYGAYGPVMLDGARELVICMMFFPLSSILFDLMQSYYRGILNNKKYGYFSTVNTVLVLLFSIIGALTYQSLGLAVMKTFAYIVSAALGIMLFKFPIRRILKADLGKINDWRLLVKISVVSMFNNSATIILQNLDILLIGNILLNADYVATYKIATYIPEAMAFIPQMLIIYIYPYFAFNSKNKKWLKTRFRQILLYFGAFNLICTIFVCVLAPTIINVLFGEGYMDAVLPLRILTITYFFNATFRNISGNLLASQRRVKANLCFGIIGIVINYIGDTILIPKYGGVGAAVVTMIVVIVVSLMSTLYLLHVFNNIPPESKEVLR